MDASRRERGGRLRMKIKGAIDEDFVNYRKPSAFVAFPKCSFKCDRECGRRICQNSRLAKEPDVDVPASEIVRHMKESTLSEAIVCGGLEPLDSFDDLMELLREFRKESDGDFVIYTGYRKEEIPDEIKSLAEYPNVIMKFGRYRPGDKPHLDPVLGVTLASDGQHAEKIS